MSASTCAVIICDANHGWSHLGGYFEFNNKKRLKCKGVSMGAMLRSWKCVNYCRSMMLQCMVKRYCEWILFKKYILKRGGGVKSTAVPTGTRLTSGASVTNPDQVLTITLSLLLFFIFWSAIFFFWQCGSFASL